PPAPLQLPPGPRLAVLGRQPARWSPVFRLALQQPASRCRPAPPATLRLPSRSPASPVQRRGLPAQRALLARPTSLPRLRRAQRRRRRPSQPPAVLARPSVVPGCLRFPCLPRIAAGLPFPSLKAPGRAPRRYPSSGGLRRPRSVLGTPRQR